jgi:SpoVK/Ycf46/Vps4 family AAA+-type ATPase
MLSVLNYKGRDVAAAALRRVAAELKADLLELDAISLALVVGTYLGQTPYWPKGTMSTLGYAVAEISGRLATSAESADESEGTISFNIPVMNRLRSFPKRDIQSVLLGSSDERWEELKMNHALETLLGQIDAKRAASGQPSTAEQPVIVHVQDYIELNAVIPEVVQKLKAVVDKSWHKGKRIILVGSSSSDINDVSQWRSQLMEEISREDCHVVPYHVDMPNKAAQQEVENVDENLLNIRTMLSALEGQGADAALDLFENKYKNMFPRRLLLESETSALGTSVYGVQTVYRLASLLLDDAKDYASRGTRPLENCLRFLDMRDGDWAQQHPNVPLLHPRGLGTNDNPLPDSEKPKDASTGAPKANIQYNAHEKKLLSGLINGENIHTTFDDIVAPEKMKESIKALTSLSLIRPEAYTYGILKTERIPGLLLYGPPGTGKTLLAKAVAKESGANMLEVSAASIMDMYVGNSEKNVQALFSIARKLSPTIIFLDEGDALLGARTSGRSRNAHREVITQFLREWDGLTNTNKHAFIIVATNRPFDLDEAVLRRLPRKLLVDLPLKDEREAILRILLKEESLDETVSLSTLAAETDLYSGSDLKNLCVAAAMEAVKQEMRDYTAAGSPKEGYAWPEKRILTRAHLDAAIKEIGASINEDMESLQAIRKFDERYGDASNKQKRRKRSMGFDIVPPTSGTEAARVRTEDRELALAQVNVR